ncbi:hypothetical protein KIPB_016019, partial [Kipferlia bialata]|eukprot:g16019.t1
MGETKTQTVEGEDKKSNEIWLNA